MICLLWAFEESGEASRMARLLQYREKDSTWFGSNSEDLGLGRMDGNIPEAFGKLP